MLDLIEGTLKIGLAVGLVVAWGSVLLPPLTRLLGGVGRTGDSIGSFRDKMSVLGTATPANRGVRAAGGGHGIGAPGSNVLDLTGARGAASRPSRAATKKRRRDILVGLLAVTGTLLPLALILGGAAWALFALSAALLGAYVALLWSVQQSHLERQRKVAYFPHAATSAPQGAAALRPVGSARR